MAKVVVVFKLPTGLPCREWSSSMPELAPSLPRLRRVAQATPVTLNYSPHWLWRAMR
jgi:hypothetical protein